MTKYEWESELKKNIHRLPSDEIKRVMEYYDELFADKIEQGLKETEIVSQFGNPVDVADKILSDFDLETAEPESVPVPDLSGKKSAASEPMVADYREPSPAKPDTEPMVPDYREPCKCSGGESVTASEPAPSAETNKKHKREFHMSRLLLFIILNVLTGFLMFIAVATVWIVFASVAVGGVASALGGAAGFVMSLGTLFAGHAAVAFVQIGMCVVAVGIGVIITVICFKSIKWIYIGTKKFLTLIFNWVFEKKEAEA